MTRRQRRDRRRWLAAEKYAFRTWRAGEILADVRAWQAAHPECKLDVAPVTLMYKHYYPSDAGVQWAKFRADTGNVWTTKPASFGGIKSLVFASPLLGMLPREERW